MKAPNVLRLLGEKKTEDNIPQNPFSNWGKLLRKAYIWAKCWWNVFNIPNERLSCEISSVSECQSDQLSSSSEETASVCGASLSREWDWGTGWAAPALGHQTAPWAGKGWARMLTFRFRIRLGEVNQSQILLQDGWARPWGWSGASAAAAC